MVGEFCRTQREEGNPGCSNGSAYNWLHIHRPKLAICPQKQDYCDSCAKFSTQTHAKRTTLNRIQQSGSASIEQQQDLEKEVKELEGQHEEHRKKAELSHEDYIQVTKQCKDQMEKNNTLQASTSNEEDEELMQLKGRFTLVLSADFQMSKLLPSWGISPQPGSTYYLQKLSHDIFGIVNHSNGKSAIYIFDECCGPKNTDHTVSYLTHFLCESGEVPSWVKRVHIYLDNASSTNKNYYMMGWANEMIKEGKFNFIRISFLIAGHTKFAPDLFSRISQTFS